MTSTVVSTVNSKEYIDSSPSVVGLMVKELPAIEIVPDGAGLIKSFWLVSKESKESESTIIPLNDDIIAKPSVV